MSDWLYEQVSITPGQLIAVLRECESRWPNATLHKNDVTRNLSIKVNDQYIGMIDLLDATLAVWADPDD